jgi:hypothetical protein
MTQTKLIVTLVFCCLMAGVRAQIPENSQDIPAQQSFEADTIKVEILSIPSGADIRVAGKSIGITPCDILLPHGRHFFGVSFTDQSDNLFAFKELYLSNDTVLVFSSETNSIEKLRKTHPEYFSTKQNYVYPNTKYSTKGKKTSSCKYGFSLGGYQKAWYTGELSNHIITHNYFIMPILTWDIWLKNALLQLSFIGGGLKANSIIINGDYFEGTFFSIGKSASYNFYLGYEVFANKDFIVVPNIGVLYSSHTIETESTAKEYHYGNAVRVFDLLYYSIGTYLDFKIFNFKNNKKNNLSLRINYDLGVMAKLDGDKTKGNIHHFTIGIFANCREFKN